ncbi:MAG: OmpA family protein [Aquabacterium sp.]
MTMKQIQDADISTLRGQCRHEILQSLNVTPAIVGAQAVLERTQIGLACKGWRTQHPQDLYRVRQASAMSLLDLMRSGVVYGQVGPGAVTTYRLATGPSRAQAAPVRSSSLRPVVQAVAFSACLAGCSTQTLYQTPRYSYFVPPASHKTTSGLQAKMDTATVKTPVQSKPTPLQGGYKVNVNQLDQPLVSGGAPLPQPSTGAHLVATTPPHELPQPAQAVQQEKKLQQISPNVQIPTAATASYLPLKKSVYFGFGKSEVQADMREVVQSMLPLARVAKTFRVTGVTDGFGDRAVNASLAKSRAQAVAQTLRSYGVSADVIEVQACTTASCWKRSADGVIAHRLNRRVDIEVMVPRSIAMGLRDQFVDIENVAEVARPGPAAQRV